MFHHFQASAPGHWWFCEGPWEVLGRRGGGLGFWEVHGVYLEVLGGSSGVLGRSLDVPRGVLGEVLGGHPKQTRFLSEGLGRVLGSSWGGLGALGWSLSRS